MTSTQIAVVVAASMLGALVKSVTGLGYPVIAIPLISLAIGVENAVVVVALPNLAANAFLHWESRAARSETRELGVLVGFGVVGALVGTLVLVRVPEEPLMLVLAATVLVFVVVFLRRPELALSDTTTRRGAPLVGLLIGFLQGAIGVSGPVVATWIHGYRLKPAAYIHSVTLIFGVTGLVQVLVLGSRQEFTGSRLVAGTAAGAAVVVATALGLRLRRRLAGAVFEHVVLAVLALSALSLVADAFL